MKMRRKWTLLAGIIVILIAAFLLVEFRIAFSNFEINKLVATTGMGDTMVAPLQQSDVISLALVGEGPLVGPLRKALVEKLGQAGLGNIELVQESNPVVQNPVLLVKVGQPSPLWTPFFATSQFSVHAGYASDGDSTFMEPVEKTHTTTAKPGVANLYAEYDVVDRSFGLISRPGYYRYMAEYLAQEIVTALKAYILSNL